MKRIRIEKLVVSIVLILFSMLVMPQAWAEGDIDVLRAAHRGNVNAMRRIGMRMYRGCSVGSPSAGIQWLERAAAKGDKESMYLLGRIYYDKKDEEMGRKFMENAASHGHRKAVIYMEKKGDAYENAKEEGELGQIQIKVDSVKNAVKEVAKTIQKKTSEANIEEVAMVDFLCNGSSEKNELSDEVRDKVQEALVEGKSQLRVTDRVDTKLLMQEGQAQQETVALKAATAVFMGEVICVPKRNLGFFIYRVFNTLDMRILAAGFVPVKWDSREKQLLEKDAPDVETFALPLSTKKQMDTMADEVKAKVSKGIAMVYAKGTDKRDTIDKRVAFAQILAALFDRGCKLYEREFYRQASEEASVSGQVVQAEKVGALSTVEFVSVSQTKNNLKVKITAYPEGHLLHVATLTQKRIADVESHT